jgi:hypothetical protein
LALGPAWERDDEAVGEFRPLPRELARPSSAEALLFGFQRGFVACWRQQMLGDDSSRRLRAWPVNYSVLHGFAGRSMIRRAKLDEATAHVLLRNVCLGGVETPL